MSIKEPAPGAVGVNWEAYSHEELYQMLWQDADVADVSTVATEWTQHRAALDTHAEVLREQRAALQESWRGPAAEEAANRLDALATRVEKISELAHAGQQAAQDAADALAMARAMMPPPAGDPAAAFGAPPPMPAMPPAPAMSSVPPVPSAPSMPSMPEMPSVPEMPTSFSSVPDFGEMFAPAPAPAPTPAPAPAPDMNNAFGAVGSGGFSFYFGAASADQQKAQAVRAMQTYESGLTGGSQRLDQARGAIPPAASATTAQLAQTTAATRAAGAVSGPGSGGVPWAGLVGAGPAMAAGSVVGVGLGSVIGGPGAPGAGFGMPLAEGARVGSLPGGAGGPGAQAGPRGVESAAARAAGHGGMAPPIGGQRGTDDERHENQMPTIDHRLFAVEVPASQPVIGETTGAQS
ncbi:WXG100 family type VII secretion target [Amycolatopsis nigrescens]|uniref:WXG100 family type VII secretion target n=1 Tax=Amycolatopsis nigrescens TaxID=381445 RepID=UPI001FE1FDEE|nr:hypothetical protein [Amycolatopsis nigrescens]